MNEIQLFDNGEFEQLPIRRATRDGLTWYAITDIAKILGRRDAQSVVDSLSKADVKQLPIRTPGGPQLMNCTTRAGLEWALARSTKPEAVRLAGLLGVAVLYAPSITNSTLAVISAALAHLPQQSEYKIGPYRIDLYFPSLRVAVECDERGHVGYDAEAEAERQTCVQRELTCRFVRYNPHAAGFNVGRVINAVMVSPGSKSKSSQPTLFAIGEIA